MKMKMFKNQGKLQLAPHEVDTLFPRYMTQIILLLYQADIS